MKFINFDKTSLLFLLVFLLTNPLLIQAQDYLEAQPGIEVWMAECIENAQQKKWERVEFPMVVRSKAWGCRCPDHYMGISPNTQEGPWIMPICPNPFPISDEKGHSLIVIGYFTGKMIRKDYRESPEEPEEWIYTLPEFKILYWRRNRVDYEAGGPKVLTK